MTLHVTTCNRCGTAFHYEIDGSGEVAPPYCSADCAFAARCGE